MRRQRRVLAKEHVVHGLEPLRRPLDEVFIPGPCIGIGALPFRAGNGLHLRRDTRSSRLYAPSGFVDAERQCSCR